MKNALIFILAASALLATPRAFADPAQKAPETKDSTAEVETPKTDKSAKPKTADDLDAFFEEGERQSEDGPSCRPKTKPIA